MPRRTRRGKHLIAYTKCNHPGPWRAVTISADKSHAYGICQACEGRAAMAQWQVDDYYDKREDHEPVLPEWQRMVNERKGKL